MSKGAQAGLEQIEPGAVQEITNSLLELNDKGICKTDQEVQQRIDEYFDFCTRSSMRPGIESLCLALHITRTTLFRWCNGIGCSEYRQEVIQNAKQVVAAFIEQASLSGKINPATAIFVMKNWMSYKDSESFEDALPKEPSSYRPAPRIQPPDTDRPLPKMPEIPYIETENT